MTITSTAAGPANTGSHTVSTAKYARFVDSVIFSLVISELEGYRLSFLAVLKVNCPQL